MHSAVVSTHRKRFAHLIHLYVFPLSHASNILGGRVFIMFISAMQHESRSAELFRLATTSVLPSVVQVSRGQNPR